MYQHKTWPEAELRFPSEAAPHGASDLVAALRRGRLLMLACLVAGLAGASGYVASAPSIYAANAQILFEPKRIEIAGAAERDFQSSIDSAQIESQVQLLKSERLSSVVIRAHKLDADPEFTDPMPSLASTLINLLARPSAGGSHNRAVVVSEFERRLDVRRVGQSYALDLWFRSTDPAKAARLANAVTAAYLGQQLGEVGRLGRGSHFQSSVEELDADRRTAAHAVQIGEIDLASFPVADARVLKAAQVPLGRSAPRAGLILPLAGLLSLGLGACFIVARQRLRQTILTRQQIEDNLGLPCLGMLPRTELFRRRGRTMLTIAADRPASAFGKGVNAVRAALDAQCDRSEPQCVGVVPARAGDGATLVAANLALAFARTGWRTLLIDCDLRSGDLPQSLAHRVSSGAPDMSRLAGSDSVTRGDGTLSVLAAGERSEADALVIGSPRFKAVLDDAREHFDRVVLDLPSIDAEPDGTVTCSWLDATVVVMAAGRTTEPVVQSMLTTLRRARVTLAGAVLNRAGK